MTTRAALTLTVVLAIGTGVAIDAQSPGTILPASEIKWPAAAAGAVRRRHIDTAAR